MSRGTVPAAISALNAITTGDRPRHLATGIPSVSATSAESPTAMSNEAEELAHSDATGAHGNRRAHDGYAYQCTACGKKSRDQYGIEPINYGFDESCALNSVLVKI
jgi:hypothetical protein